MKFGKVIRKAIAICPEEWQDYWINYKSFKRSIAEVNEEKKEKEKGKEQVVEITSLDGEKELFYRLTEDALKVEKFFKTIQLQYGKEVKAFIEDAESLNGINTKAESLLGRCRELHCNLLLLEMYAHVNYCGFAKITKKHDKITGYSTQQKFLSNRINRMTFSKFYALQELVHIVEKQYIALAKQLRMKDSIYQMDSGIELNELNTSLKEIEKHTIVVME